jgi:surfactin synthase thioesterase subunit
MITTLFCLPYAGAGASAFHPLRNAANGTDIAPRPVLLPGRERRIDEQPWTDLDDAVEQLTAELMGEASSAERVALFGHSFGAVLAFEMARRFARGGVRVARLFISGCPGPWQPRQERAAGLDDDGFVAQVEVLAGYRHEALRHPRLRGLLLPVLRADVTMHERYLPPPGTTITVPITAIRGADDQLVSAEQLRGWRSATTSAFETVQLAGGHMYLLAEPDQLLAVIAERLSQRGSHA